MKKVRDMLKGMRGFTLVELMVVIAILAVLAAIVVPSVVGVTSTGKATAKTEDINAVQSGVDRYSNDSDTGAWPTLVEVVVAPATPAWTAGSLPTANKYAGIDWVATTNVGGVSKAFYPDYIKKLPKHDDETATDGILRWRIDSGGVVSVEMDGTSY